MGLFSSPRIEGEDLKRCLDYLESEVKVIAFQTRETDLFNSTMTQYVSSIRQNPTAAEEVYKAANRFVQASREVLRRHHEIKDIPEAATKARSVWRAALNATAMWAITSAEEIAGTITGMPPDWGYVQRLIDDYKRARRRAQAEDKSFIKRLELSAEDIAAIIARAAKDDSVYGNWQPPTNEEIVLSYLTG